MSCAHTLSIDHPCRDHTHPHHSGCIRGSVITRVLMLEERGEGERERSVDVHVVRMTYACIFTRGHSKLVSNSLQDTVKMKKRQRCSFVQKIVCLVILVALVRMHAEHAINTSLLNEISSQQFTHYRYEQRLLLSQSHILQTTLSIPLFIFVKKTVIA